MICNISSGCCDLHQDATIAVPGQEYITRKDVFMKLYDALDLGKNELVCFVGAGGKTGLMQKLLGECAQQGGSVLVTTSTKMYKGQLTECCRLLLEQDEDKLRKKLIDASASERVLAAAKELIANHKVVGLSREAIGRLYDSGIFDFILVEADGAKGRGLKAPASFEPQVPDQTTCVVVIAGVDVLGKPLTEEYVHRHHIVAELAKQRVGTPVTAKTLLSVFRYYRSLLNRSSPGLRVIPALNKADDEYSQHKAKNVARVLFPEMGRVLITSTLSQKPVQEVVC
ncbi:MAG: selenium cofactor biosynthesis protein YqeC [Syntrophaceticus sp.]